MCMITKANSEKNIVIRFKANLKQVHKYIDPSSSCGKWPSLAACGLVLRRVA